MSDVPPATGRPTDPGWKRYFRWPPSHFPIQFPACRVTLEEEPHDTPGEVRLTWIQEGSVPLLGRVVTADGELLHELPPRLPEPGEATWTERVTVHRRRAPRGIGLGFSWWFYVPPVERVPQHPMGVVLGDADYLFGSDVRVRVTPERRE